MPYESPFEQQMRAMRDPFQYQCESADKIPPNPSDLWREIESAAIDDATLHAIVACVRKGADREEVLMTAVLAQARTIQELKTALTDALANMPARHIVIPSKLDR